MSLLEILTNKRAKLEESLRKKKDRDIHRTQTRAERAIEATKTSFTEQLDALNPLFVVMEAKAILDSLRYGNTLVTSREVLSTIPDEERQKLLTAREILYSLKKTSDPRQITALVEALVPDPEKRKTFELLSDPALERKAVLHSYCAMNQDAAEVRLVFPIKENVIGGLSQRFFDRLARIADYGKVISRSGYTLGRGDAVIHTSAQDLLFEAEPSTMHTYLALICKSKSQERTRELGDALVAKIVALTTEEIKNASLEHVVDVVSAETLTHFENSTEEQLVEGSHQAEMKLARRGRNVEHTQRKERQYQESPNEEMLLQEKKDSAYVRLNEFEEGIPLTIKDAAYILGTRTGFYRWLSKNFESPRQGRGGRKMWRLQKDQVKFFLDSMEPKRRGKNIAWVWKTKSRKGNE